MFSYNSAVPGCAPRIAWSAGPGIGADKAALSWRISAWYCSAPTGTALASTRSSRRERAITVSRRDCSDSSRGAVMTASFGPCTTRPCNLAEAATLTFKLQGIGCPRQNPQRLARGKRRRHLPVASERLDQEDRREQALATELGRKPLGGEQRLLRRDDVEIRRRPAFVARIGEIEDAPRRLDGRARLRVGPLEVGQAGDAVFDFLHRVEHDEAIVADRRVVAGLRKIDVGAEPAAAKERLRHRGANR